MAKFLAVFDINGTLLKRLHKTNPELRKLALQGVECDHRYRQYFVFERPGLRILVEFLDTHDVDYAFWTTARANNAGFLIDHLASVGFTRCRRRYSQMDCKVGKRRFDSDASLWVKDLWVAAQDHGVDIRSCILVDDSVDKSVHTQNFICCSEFMPGEEDSGIVEICRHLDEFLGCRDDCVAKRL